MAIIVQKFGCTSVASVERIEAVADKVAGFRDNGDDVVVVVSAMSGETNRLTEMAHEWLIAEAKIIAVKQRNLYGFLIFKDITP